MGIFLLLLAMFSIQFGASLAKQLFPDLGASGTTALRVFISALILSLFARPWKMRLKKNAWQRIALYGLSLGSMNLLFYLSLKRIPLGVAVAVEFIGPLGVSLFLSRKGSDLLWILLAVGGILLLVPTDFSSPGALDVQGLLLALAAGVFWGLYIVFGRRASEVGTGLQVASLGMWFAALTVLPWGLIYQGPAMLNVSLWPLAIAVALFSSAIPYALEMQSLKKIPAKTFGVLMSMEPAVATLIGFIFLHEVLEWRQWLAIFCVAMASAGSTLSHGGSKEPPV